MRAYKIQVEPREKCMRRIVIFSATLLVVREAQKY